MKKCLGLAMMMLISVCAWAMPSAKYIPADAAMVMTFSVPAESSFVKELKKFLEKDDDPEPSMGMSMSLAPDSPLSPLEPYGLKAEMIREGFAVLFPSKDGEMPLGMILVEGTFDADAVLAKIRKSPEALEEEDMVCGKVPGGGLYLCSTSLEKRVKALLASKEKPIAATSAFAKLVNERVVPKRLAIRALVKGGKGGMELPIEDISAVRVSLVERVPRSVTLDVILYARSATPITQIDAQVRGAKLMIAAFSKDIPGLKGFINQVKTKADATKKRFTLSASLKVKDLEMIQAAIMGYIFSQMGASMGAGMGEAMGEAATISIIDEEEDTDPVREGFKKSSPFKIEKLEDFVGKKDQSKTFIIEGHTVTLRAEDRAIPNSYRGLDGVWTKMPDKPGINWKLTYPKTLEIDLMDMNITQGDDVHLPYVYVSEDRASRNKGGRDDDLLHKEELMFSKPSGDIEIVFHYRIKD